MADLLWPIVIVEDVPAGWLSDLRRLSSAQVATVVQRFRAAPLDERERVSFYRDLAAISVRAALVNLLQDLSDPKRGGAVLAAVCASAEVPAPSQRTAEQIFRWAIIGVAAAATTGVIGNRVDALVVSAWEQLAHGGSAAVDTPDPTGAVPVPQAHRGHGSFIDDIFS
jgi:hypothetical protein